MRLKSDMFQEDLAKEMDINRSTISYWERGKQEPTFDNVLKLCDILDTSPNYLLGYDDDETTVTRDPLNSTPQRKNNIS